MKFAKDLVENLLLPKLNKDSNFDNNNINVAFWENFTQLLLDYERDAKPIYTAIYELELENTERIISKLPTIYETFIKELAENFVIGNTDEASTYLLQIHNKLFESDVQYFKDLQKAIKKVERIRLKSEIPTLYKRLTFELTNEEIELAIKKKQRESLKEKMNVWKLELEEFDSELTDKNQTTTFYQNPKNEKNESENKEIKRNPKIISLWIKYAVAACVLITSGVFYFKSFNSQTIPNTLPEFAYETTTVKNTVLSPTNSLGFAGTKKENVIEVQFNDASIIIAKINDKIKEEIVNARVSGSDSIVNMLKNQLKEISLKQGNYEFDGKKLILYSSLENETIQIITTDGKTYFLKKGNLFYKLQITKIPLRLVEISDADNLDQLNKIVFDNEK